MSGSSDSSWRPGDPIPYIRQEIPPFAVPPYAGERYPATVPATLDLQERAALAVNGLTGPLDPEKDYMLYFNANFRTNPPSMHHRGSDICVVKFQESLPLMRLASGSGLNDQVDPVWMASALRQIGPDGLVYWPFFPWVKVPDWGIGYAESGQDAGPRTGFYSVPLFVGRRIGAMTLYRLRDPSGPWDAEIRRIVDGLRAVAIDRGDYAYFPQGEFYPDRPRPRDAAMPVGIWSSLVGWTIQGLAQYHRVSGYEPAVDLAGRLARYLAHHGRYYGRDGEFLPNYAGADGGQVPDREGVPGFRPGSAAWKEYIHFQHHMVPLLGTLDHALAVGDKGLAEFVRRAYEWARGKGNVLVGYFPENIDRPDLQTSELCEVAAMIGLALKLSAAGLGDYWDDADRWVRNQFAEGQLRRADWAYRLGERGPAMPGPGFDPAVHCCDRVPERNLGAFAGWPSANDWGWGIMHCCTGNATRALYYIWEHILAYRDGQLRVNLLLNRASAWADVDSHIPYAGQVDIKVKQAVELAVRLPEWVQPEQVRVQVNSQKRQVGFEGRYAWVGWVEPGDVARLSFPIPERRDEAWIEKDRYTLIRRGNEVVHVEPQGTSCPLYQRDHYREGATLWRQVERFVPEQQVEW